MDELDRYLDRLFHPAVQSREVRRLKRQVSEHARADYERRIAEGLSEPDARAEVLAAIGTEEDLKAEYPVKNPLLYILALCCAVLTAAGVAYAVYYLKNEYSFSRYFNLMSLWILRLFVIPALFLCGTYLALFTAGALSRPLRTLAIRRKSARITVLILCIGLTALYVLVTASQLSGLFSFGIGVFLIAAFFSRGYCFIVLGLLLYFGVKKQQYCRHPRA